MKFNKHSKVEECVSTDAARPVLHNVFLDVEAKSLMATDGRMMAIVPVETEEGDVTGYVTPEALKAARKASGRLDGSTLSANGDLKLLNGQSFPRPSVDNVGKFPNYKQVIPDADREVKFTVALDAELLHSLAKALATNKASNACHVTLEFFDNLSPIIVKGHGGKGVLMPCRIS